MKNIPQLYDNRNTGLKINRCGFENLTDCDSKANYLSSLGLRGFNCELRILEPLSPLNPTQKIDYLMLRNTYFSFIFLYKC